MGLVIGHHLLTPEMLAVIAVYGLVAVGTVGGLVVVLAPGRKLDRETAKTLQLLRDQFPEPPKE